MAEVPDQKQPISALLRELRESRGQSLRAAARELGVDASYLSRVETGQKRLPDGFRMKVADYYETDLELVALAEGQIPDDVRRILVAHPEALEDLRRRYGAS